jgi:NTE family protein
MSGFNSTVRRALILSGGGGRGAYQVGVWRRLQELGWQPDMVCGTSIGSLNGALIGSGWDADRLETAWHTMNDRDIFSISWMRRLKYHLSELLGRSTEWPGYLDNGPLRQLLNETIELASLRNDQPTVAVAATNIRRAKLEYFSGQQLTIDHILASCSIPVLFPWVDIGGEYYWDGGIMANTPILPALNAGAVEIIVVLLAPLAGAEMQLPHSTASALSWALDLATVAPAQSLVRTLALHTGRDAREHESALVDHHYIDMGDIRFGVVAPESMSGIQTMLDLDTENIKRRISEGYRDAQTQLAGFMDDQRVI